MQDVKHTEQIDRRKTITFFFSSFIMLLMTVWILCVMIAEGKSDYGAFMNYFATFVGMVFSLILFLCCNLDKQYLTKQGLIFSSTVASIFVELMLTSAISLLEGNSAAVLWIKLMQTFSSIIAAVIHLLFWFYLKETLSTRERKNHFTFWIVFLNIFYVLIIILNQWTETVFFVDENARIVINYGGLNPFFSFVIYMSYLIYILAAKCSVRKKAVLSTYSFFPLLYTVINFISYKIGLSFSFVPSLYIFLLFSAYIVFFNVFLEDRDELLANRIKMAEQEKEQTEMKNAIMVSQISPHFLYNALSTISGICEEENAPAASKAIDRFADYLRGNLDVLKKDRLIPFQKEIEHIKTYLWIQQIRFGDDIKVIYNIEYDNFMLPPLLVQPLVENAVSHGILKKEEGGTVVISSQQTNEGIMISVKDDGVGFDADSKPDDNRLHIGLENVKQRIELIRNGNIKVNSEIGKGTEVILLIPEKLS